MSAANSLSIETKQIDVCRVCLGRAGQGHTHSQKQNLSGASLWLIYGRVICLFGSKKHLPE